MFNGKNLLIVALLLLFVITGCEKDKKKETAEEPEKKQVGVVHPDWSKDAVIYEANIRQHTPEGTFAAFEKHLPQLKEMGIDIIWLMPIHPIGEENRKGTLGSYYSVQDYKGVNPEFGTMDDLKSLVDEIHGMGMHVIIDWVANHTAWDHKWMTENPDFYTKDSLGSVVSPVPDWTDVADLNYDNKELWAKMTDALKYWVVEADIDGYRCDVAAMVPSEFWAQARDTLETYKNVFMLAEAHEPELHENGFDMTYNWELKDVMNAIAKGEKDVSALDEHLAKENNEYGTDDYRMNFTTNHDENSWSGTVFERLGEGSEVFAVLACTFPDMPLIYSGQEAGMDKRLDFFEKDEVEWKDHQFRALYTKLFELKKNNKALWNGTAGGEVVRLHTSDDTKVFAFMREKGNDKVFVVMNLSGENATFDINKVEMAGKYTNLFTNEEVELNTSETFLLPPWKYLVYHSTN